MRNHKPEDMTPREILQAFVNMNDNDLDHFYQHTPAIEVMRENLLDYRESIKHIKETSDRLRLFRDRHRVSPDWHNADEQCIVAGVFGDRLGDKHGEDMDSGESVIVLHPDYGGEDGHEADRVVVNLSAVLALAAACFER